MFRAKAAFSGFSVDDLTKAKAFYQETLGLNVDRDGVGLGLHLPGGGTVFAYPKKACGSSTTQMAHNRRQRHLAGQEPEPGTEHRVVQGPCRQYPVGHRTGVIASGSRSATPNC